MASVDASVVGPQVEAPLSDISDEAEPALTAVREEPMTVAPSTKSTKSISRVNSTQCSAFHIPALVGWPHAEKSSLRQRPVLACSDPQVRKRFTLTMYTMLCCQIAAAALVASAITAAILTPGWLPNEIGPSTTFWMPAYPINVLMTLCPMWLFTVFSFVCLSFARGSPQIRRPLLLVATLASGIFFGLLTYLENAFPMLLIGVVLTSLVVHTFGIAMNFVSFQASFLEQVKPMASKMEIMARTSCLTGTEKFICLLHDEEAAYTEASIWLAGFSWTVASITVALIAFVHDIAWMSLFFAAFMACPAVIYLTYGVEKQVRRCKPEEIEKAMVNMSVDFLFFAAGCVTVDLSTISWQELGTAKPCPVDKGVLQYAMKQVSSTTTQSTTVAAKISAEQRSDRVAIAV